MAGERRILSTLRWLSFIQQHYTHFISAIFTVQIEKNNCKLCQVAKQQPTIPGLNPLHSSQTFLIRYIPQGGCNMRHLYSTFSSPLDQYTEPSTEIPCQPQHLLSWKMQWLARPRCYGKLRIKETAATINTHEILNLNRFIIIKPYVPTKL